MKKGKYIDIYVIMACMSRKKQNGKLNQVDEMLDKICKNCEETSNKNFITKSELVYEESAVHNNNYHY